MKRNATMHGLSLLAFTTLFLPGCDRGDFRNGYSPGEVEVIDNGKVFHLADGVFIEETKSGGTVYYLVESTVRDYELTAEGLHIELEGEKAGTYSTKPAPQGYVAAWITEVPGEGPGVTRFQIDDATLAGFPKDFSATITVQDVFNLRQ